MIHDASRSRVQSARSARIDGSATAVIISSTPTRNTPRANANSGPIALDLPPASLVVRGSPSKARSMRALPIDGSRRMAYQVP